jgi:hypothetical protein
MGGNLGVIRKPLKTLWPADVGIRQLELTLCAQRRCNIAGPGSELVRAQGWGAKLPTCSSIM